MEDYITITVDVRKRSTKVNIDNAAGSARYFQIVCTNDETKKPIDIEFTPNNGTVEIDGHLLSDTQRKLLIEFLSQPDLR